MTIDPRLQRLLGSPDLAQLRQRLRKRLEDESDFPSQFRLLNLLPHERTVLAGLTGAPTQKARSFTLDVSAIDSMLVEANLASSLRHALELLDGPIVNRAAVLNVQRQRWESVVDGVGHESLSAWLKRTANLGLVKRHSGGEADAAARTLSLVELVLKRLPTNGMTRAELAAAVLGDAHALDPGRPEASIVLAVLRHARRADEEVQDIEEDRRETWASAGVLVNELARPALFLNLPILPAASGSSPAQLGTPGEPAFISLRKLLRTTPAWHVVDRDVFVCENPNVVAIAADRLGQDCAPLVCTEGMPAAAQRTLLSQLVSAGAKLWYHGDFDWPGIRIANVVMREHGAQPWRMGTSDYESAVEAVGTRVPLAGTSAEAAWDETLGTRMSKLNVSVAEEALVNRMLIDLEVGAVAQSD